MTSNQNKNRNFNLCSYFKSITSLLYYSCFPKINQRSSPMTERDENINSEWKDLYDRINKLENNSMTEMNPLHQPIVTQEPGLQNIITKEIKELLTRMEKLEKTIDNLSNTDNEIRLVHKDETNTSINSESSSISSIVEIDIEDFNDECESNETNEETVKN